MTDQVFSLKHNAKRAAEKMIGDGTAPSLDYRISKREDGKYEIVWEPMPEEQEVYIEADDAPASEVWSEDAADAAAMDRDDEGPWPVGTRVQVGNRKTRIGTIVRRVDETHWRVAMDADPKGTDVLYKGAQFTATDPAVPAKESLPAKKKRVERVGRKHEKTADLDAAAARGVMPPKPIVTSKANPHYQKRFDLLTQKAAEGDWDAVRNYACTGVNSYAKMVRQYQARLLAAHAASEPEFTEAAE